MGSLNYRPKLVMLLSSLWYFCSVKYSEKEILNVTFLYKNKGFKVYSDYTVTWLYNNLNLKKEPFFKKK